MKVRYLAWAALLLGIAACGSSGHKAAPADPNAVTVEVTGSGHALAITVQSLTASGWAADQTLAQHYGKTPQWVASTVAAKGPWITRPALPWRQTVHGDPYGIVVMAESGNASPVTCTVTYPDGQTVTNTDPQVATCVFVNS